MGGNGGRARLLPLLLPLLLTGCVSQSTSGAAQVSSGIVPTVDSLPLPPGFRQAEGGTLTGLETRMYRPTSGQTLDQVDAWYQRRLPQGQSWQDWSPCDSTAELTPNPIPSQPGLQRSWHKDGRILVLAVSEHSGQVLIAMSDFIPPSPAIAGAPIC